METGNVLSQSEEKKYPELIPFVFINVKGEEYKSFIQDTNLSPNPFLFMYKINSTTQHGQKPSLH